MVEFINRILAWHHSRDRGASAVEYALLVAAIVVVIGGIVFALGDQVTAIFSRTCRAVNDNVAC